MKNKDFISYFFEIVKFFLRKTSFYKSSAINKKLIMSISDINIFLNEAPPLLLNNEFYKKPYVGIVKTQLSNLKDGYDNPKASWLRYERFCKNNNIKFDFYDIKRSDWLEEAKKFDIIICHTEGTPAYQEFFESKVYILEKILNKSCFPSFHEVWQYEDKNRSNYLYQCYHLPTIPTIATNDQKEALIVSKKLGYPYIAKTTIGAGSSGVFKVDNEKQTKAIVNRIFSNSGLTTQYPYKNQKDYFYCQKFIDDATFDLRIMLVGDMAFGYYRYPNKGDFRASGSGKFEKKEIPLDALKLAIEIRDKLKSRQMGVDLLYSEKYSQYFIIETSLFNQIDSCEQLEIDGKAGYYDISDINNICFKEGKFWIQELTLRNVLIEWAGLPDNINKS